MSSPPLILICDDESHIVHVVSLKLRNAGYEVLTAPDGQEGLELALQHRPDLLITDYQMPFLTGVELCAALREHESTRDIPALMLTARGFRLDPIETRRARIDDIMSKPFSPRELLTHVQKLLATPSETREHPAASPPPEANAST